MKITFVLISLMICLGFAAYRPPTIKLAVMDSGLDISDERFKDVLCPSGHKDYTNTGIEDKLGHGTFITGLIKQYAGESSIGSYCIVILKYTDGANVTRGIEADVNFKKALRVAADYDVVNISGGGNLYSDFEHRVIKHSRAKFIVAAGNDNQNLDFAKYYTFYPASYILKGLTNIDVIGNKKLNGEKADSSNFGSMVRYEVGEDVESTLPDGEYGHMSGTSISTAIATGKKINELLQ